MCGIFGYATHNVPLTVRQVLNTLLEGLKKVEYRGYDSAGLCIDGAPPEDSSVDDEAGVTAPVVIRSVGNIAALRALVFSEATAQRGVRLDAVVRNITGIAHTRWATHGEVCVRNCHPQQSNHGEFLIVHNGIMTNYRTVKAFLLNEGYHFESETDTEVICVLAEYLYEKKGMRDFVELVAQLTRLVEGAYALLIKSVYFPGELIGCRRGSPLVVAVRVRDAKGKVVRCNYYESLDPHNQLEVYIASDSNSFAEYTNNIVYLEDGDMVHYAHGSLHFYAANEMLHESVAREFQLLETTLESLSKGNFPHFMLKEIYEQGETVMGSMRGRIDFNSGAVHLGGFTARNVHNLCNSRRLLLISCGTSLNSCYAVRPLFEELLPMPITVENASDFLDRTPRISRADACFFVSQSGETADTLMALQLCRESGALCVGVTNVVGSSISRLTDFGAHLNAGAEVGVASTKAYTSQVVVLTLVALLLSADSVQLQARRRDVVQGLAELSAKLNETLQGTATAVEQLARGLRDATSVLILGRGFDYATAIEGALKVKELSYVHTEGINSGELKHGPLALVDEHMPVIAICSDDAHLAKSKAAVQQVHARKGNVVVLTNCVDDAELADAASTVICVPRTVDCLQCIVNIIPFQLLAYHMALQRGNNIDCPRNLAKSVTVQ